MLEQTIRCHPAHIIWSIVGVLRKSIVHEVAITQRVRLDHVISRGCRQRQMTQLPFRGCSSSFDHAMLTSTFWDRGSTPEVLFLRSKVIGNVRFIEKNDRQPNEVGLHRESHRTAFRLCQTHLIEMIFLISLINGPRYMNLYWHLPLMRK